VAPVLHELPPLRLRGDFHGAPADHDAVLHILAPAGIRLLEAILEQNLVSHAGHGRTRHECSRRGERDRPFPSHCRLLCSKFPGKRLSRTGGPRQGPPASQAASHKRSTIGYGRSVTFRFVNSQTGAVLSAPSPSSPMKPPPATSLILKSMNFL